MFTINSQIVARDRRLTKGSRLLMAEIISLSKAEYGCIAKDSTLANYLGVTTRTIQTYLSELKHYRYIEIDTELEEPNRPESRVIVPTSMILIDIKKARKQYRKMKQKNLLPNDIESDWLEDYIKNL